MTSHFLIDPALGGEGTNAALLSGELTVADCPNFDNLFKMLDLIVKYGDEKQLEYDWEIWRSNSGLYAW